MIPFSQLYFSENNYSKNLRDKFLKQDNNISYDCDKLLLLKTVFYSEENIDIINKQLILSIYKKSNKKHLISHQDPEKLNIIMNYAYLNYSKHYNCNITEQIKVLNNIVVDLIINDILAELDIRLHYINEINVGKKLIDLPINTGKTKMLDSISSIL